ncbi:MAG: gliding motility-associated ABC transporter permease subunit GldF [Prevotellaceae bacterium]|jgi:ABC-2 type transport system permease protein|nr:gliding motility-associated ABC transporter permease subunit GldF [Prevotellaceae bacterium]
MIVLLKKELRSFFSSATGYIVIGVFLLITGLFLWVFPGEYNVLESGYAQLDGLFSLAPWLYLFLVPAVTMRSFAEEKRTGTIELLYTKPVSTLQLVLGKYLASVVLVMLSLLPVVIYYFTVWYLAEPIGNVDTGAFWGSFIGLFCLATVYVAIGVFASSVTENQIVSFIFAMLLCFVFFLGFDLVASIFSSGKVITAIQSLGINAHYESMSRGVIDSRDVVYFLTVSIVFIFATKWIVKR